ncbi:uncharacterized mitochondrial protein AtMg00710-like [Nicotiana sylvestris]|uniref:uncharacterized mitochondrial protein AtMg00710-like n=1 Tax=Nicotiana sylvestris TaxID=4096 RepID=UPI00388C7F9B
MARTMLIDIGLAKNFWAEDINTAFYLVNRCMIKSILNKTPYELLNGRKPKLTYLRTFGCKYYVLNNGRDQLGSSMPKVTRGYFLSTHLKARLTRYITSGLNVLKKASMLSLMNLTHHLRRTLTKIKMENCDDPADRLKN